ncbi:type II toxin-antitoxin system HicA family toxin [Candidatus Magnetobacterium casense]|uniref:type II toxin-antitoxin system HicA family toxin n=1 Tax=Candidatus Magnetobacterium casense TaxID=1455061 RepID=UPI0005903607
MPIDYKQLRSLKAGDLVNAILKDGFYLRHQTGSHQQYLHSNGRRVTVSYHKSGETFTPKILRSMIEIQAEWTEEDLKRLKIIK